MNMGQPAFLFKAGDGQRPKGSPCTTILLSMGTPVPFTATFALAGFMCGNAYTSPFLERLGL